MKSGFLMFTLFLTTYLNAFNLSNWKDITDGIDGRKLVDMYIANDNRLFIANVNGVYKSREGGGRWEGIFFVNGEEQIVDIEGTEKRIFISTRHRIYAGEIEKNNFQEIFSVSGENKINAIELSPSQKYLYIGTQKGLWVISLKINGERKYLGEIRNITTLRAHPFEPDILFAGTEEGLYKISKRNINLLYTSISKTFARVNSIAISKSNDDIIFIATDSGLLRMRLKNKEFRDLKLNRKIFYVESFNTKPEQIVALGERDIFYSQNGLDKWLSLTGVIPNGMPLKIIHSSTDSIVLLTDSGIFQSEEGKLDAISLEHIEQIFSSEPTIEEMERAVIKSYMIDRNIIKRWRRNSRLRALLPEIDIGVSVKIDRDYDLDIKDTIYTSASTGKFFIGPDERKLSDSWGRDFSYGIKLSWKLPEAIFNSNELSVSNEAEDILDLRYKVLSDLRRVYFERRRIIAELYLLPAGEEYKKFELKNRIDELTAYLDMLSDGYFTKTKYDKEENSWR